MLADKVWAVSPTILGKECLFACCSGHHHHLPMCRWNQMKSLKSPLPLRKASSAWFKYLVPWQSLHIRKLESEADFESDGRTFQSAPFSSAHVHLRLYCCWKHASLSNQNNLRKTGVALSLWINLWFENWDCLLFVALQSKIKRQEQLAELLLDWRKRDPSNEVSLDESFDQTGWILLALRQWQWKLDILSHEAKANQEHRKLRVGARGERRVIQTILSLYPMPICCYGGRYLSRVLSS